VDDGGRPPTSQNPRPPPELLGRRSECEALDQILADALAGRSGVTVLRGEAGVGKSALLGCLSDRVAGWHVAKAVGVESEMELDYAGLHQLCAPVLDRLGRLPAPQRDALATVFGRGAGAAPDRFLVGLATLTLFAEVAEEQPLVCLVDDAQWLDQASAQVLGFVARRLLAERVAVVCATRTEAGDDVLTGLPELSVRGLGDRDARALLLAGVPGPLDTRVCDQIVAESHGNPLALLELPRTWNVTGLAGGFGFPSRQPVASRIEQSYIRRLQPLPPDTRLLVLMAAAEPLGDPVLFHRAAGRLGVDLAAAGPAQDSGLLELGGRVEFAHPLVRSAVYRSAAANDRRRVHRALAEATMAGTDPDRRAWHRARAAPGPDEEVAAELERSADRAQARGGVAAAAAFLQRSAQLTVEPARRAERSLTAAQVSFQAGEFGEALQLAAAAEAEPLDRFQRARVDGPVAGGDILGEICRAARALPPRPGPARPLDLLLDGLARLITDGHTAAIPALQRAAKALADLPVEDLLRWGWMAQSASVTVWDDEASRATCARNVRLVREAGALAELPIHLSGLGIARSWAGDFAGAAAIAAEADSVAAATGGRPAPQAWLRLQALKGREVEAVAAIEQAVAEGPGVAIYAHWAAAVLYNGLARYEEASAAARQASSTTSDYLPRHGPCPNWSRRPGAQETPGSRAMRSSGWPGSRGPAAPTSRSASRRAPAPC
jgi:tetratricopeptide (TPR) repeat protein